MNLLNFEKNSRRAFLRKTGQLALSGAALPMGLNLAAIGEAAAFSAAPGDYKALVCIFLNGGNDGFNTVVPYDLLNYDRYSAVRGGGAGRTAGGIALAHASLQPTLLNPLSPPRDSQGTTTRQFALHSNMSGMAALFNAGKAAIQLNVGPLVRPLTRAQYDSKNYDQFPRPPRLFSHNDQTSVWQSSSAEGSQVGWGGNLGDVALANQMNGKSLFTCISVRGNSVLLSGDTAVQYQLTTNGVTQLNPQGSAYSSPMVKMALNLLVTQTTSSHKLENEYNRVTRRAVIAQGTVSSALGAGELSTAFATDELSRQLKMVARLIKGRAVLGARRQVFYVSLGGFDTHSGQLGAHASGLSMVSAAMKSFYDATVELGVADQVTAFTASEFGRTMNGNGDGTDHGWGNHHFVVGGAVDGQRFFGTAPPVGVNDQRDSAGNYLPQAQWQVGRGSLLPSTSVDQYAATLARWFGVSTEELPNILPNIRNFGGEGYPLDLGFMRR